MHGQPAIAGAGGLFPGGHATDDVVEDYVWFGFKWVRTSVAKVWESEGPTVAVKMTMTGIM